MPHRGQVCVMGAGYTGGVFNLHRVRGHLRWLLGHLSNPTPPVTLWELQRRLILAHRDLQPLLPPEERFSPDRWERWSLLLYHFRQQDFLRDVQEAFQLTLGRPTTAGLQEASRLLVQGHFRLVLQGTPLEPFQ